MVCVCVCVEGCVTEGMEDMTAARHLRVVHVATSVEVCTCTRHREGPAGASFHCEGGGATQRYY